MPEQSSALEDQALFASKFLRGTTNLAQRRRYQEDIQAAKNEEADLADHQFARANQRAELADPLKARTLRLDEQRLDRSITQFDTQEKRLHRAMEIDQRALNLRKEQQDWNEDQKLIELEDAKTILTHTRDLRKSEAALRAKGIKAGTPEYANAALEWMDKFDHADPKLLDSVWQATRIEESLPDILAKKRALQEQGVETRMRWTQGQNGKYSFGLSEVAPVAEADPLKKKRELEKDLRSANQSLLGAGSNPEMKKYWSKRVQDTSAELIKLDSGAQQPAAQVPADGSPKPIDRDTAASILKEFGGDKEKARAAARERGFHF